MSEAAPAGIEAQKVSLSEKILKWYWEQRQPFRKLNEYKQNGGPLPTGSEAWRMLKLYIRFSGESHIPFPSKVASDVGVPESTIEALYKLADKENQK